MCRKSILFVLICLVFTYVFSKEVKSQAPVKPQAVSPSCPVTKANDAVQVPAKAVSLSPPLLIGQDTDADRAKFLGKVDSVERPFNPPPAEAMRPGLSIPSLAPATHFGSQAPVPLPPPAVIVTTVAPRKSGNIWSIQIEQADGKNIIRATIGKKSAVRIVCDQVDLQTPRDIFQAQGNVELSGEGVQGRCEKLTINLNEDRLNLDGKAEVGIYKQQGNAKDAPGASQKFLLELKGEQLSLRWPDLQAKVQEPPQPPPVSENAKSARGPAITDVPQTQPVPYTPPSQD
ncbi:MAG TPA: hypothetical protein VNX28_00895 [Gemmataceae bacterium]|nr:hypothetical protein [Gemmataceae bacterium]